MANLIQSLVTPTGDGTHNYLGDAAQQKFFVLALTKRAVPYLVLFEDAQFTTIPKNSGGMSQTVGPVSFRKYRALWNSATDGATRPLALTEGLPPPSKDMFIDEVTCFLKQYGDWIKVSDLSQDASVDGILTHAAEALGEYEGQKLHRVMLYALDDSSNKWYGDGTVSSEVTITATMILNAALCRKLVRSLKRMNAARFPDGFYYMIVEPGQIYDLQGDPNFTDIAKYNGGIAAGGGPNLLTGEMGRGWGIRFKEANELLMSSPASTPPSLTNVYHSYLYGPNGFGMLDLAGQAVRRVDPRTNRGIEIFTQPVNQPDKLDPMGQLGFVSCKVAFAGVVFDPNQVMTVMTAATP